MKLDEALPPPGNFPDNFVPTSSVGHSPLDTPSPAITLDNDIRRACFITTHGSLEDRDLDSCFYPLAPNTRLGIWLRLKTLLFNKQRNEANGVIYAYRLLVVDSLNRFCQAASMGRCGRCGCE